MNEECLPLSLMNSLKAGLMEDMVEVQAVQAVPE
jgi:hypothetical protein